MSLAQPGADPMPDSLLGEALGQRRWSPRLLLVLACGWTFVATAFFASWLPEAGESTQTWRSQLVWYGLTYALWFGLSNAVFFLSRAFPIPGPDNLRNGAVHLLAALTTGALHVSIFLPIYWALDPEAHTRFPSLTSAFQTNLLYRTLTGAVTYGLVLSAFSTDAALRRLRLEERRYQALSRQLAEAQLQALRMQIHPHFLFNTLHSISSLIYEAPSQALTMVSRLGDFLRATLERSADQTVRFEEELKFAQLYLEIEKVRFGDRLDVLVEVAPETLDMAAPTLILQPLIENAIRHGVAPAVGPVRLSIAARSRDGSLEIVLCNVELEADPAAAQPAVGEGLGLANTRARLQRMYGHQASLTCARPGPGAFEVTVRTPSAGAVDAGA